MRTYRVVLSSDAAGIMDKHILANWYDDACKRAVKWAENDPQHKQYSPWKALGCEVAA